MRNWLAGAVLALAFGTAAAAKPVTMYVGPAHTPATLYGPADMLCDLNTCRLFSLPKELGLPAGTIAEFGLPQLSGQDRVDIRRCLQICRASVLGWENKQSGKASGSSAITIMPIELRLE